MTISEAGGGAVRGALAVRDGAGAVRLECDLDAPVRRVWAAITEPDQLARWHAVVSGDLRPGGEIEIYQADDDWAGVGRVEECDAPRWLRLTTRESVESWAKGQGVPPFDESIEVELVEAGDGTRLSVEVRGMPRDVVQFYGVGWQLHAERLSAHLAGVEYGDAEARFEELLPAYEAMAAALGSD